MATETETRGSTLVEPLALIDPGALAPLDRAVSASTQDRIRRSVADNTRDAYARQWATFAAWCEREGRTAEPATGETLADYLNAMVNAGAAIASCKQAQAAIRTRHRAAGHPNQPDIEKAKAVLRTAARDKAEDGQGGQKQSLPIVVLALRQMIETCQGGTLLDTRDHALLTLGIAIFARRSDLARLNLADLRSVPEGMNVRLRLSKTDQEGRGVDVPVLHGAYEGTDPIRAVNRWRDALGSRGIDHGRLFRSVDRHGRIGASLSGTAINEAVRNRARLAGVADADQYTAHSLRAGAATIAYMNGAPVSEICRLGRWAPGSSVVLRYIRAVDQWKNHPFRGVL